MQQYIEILNLVQHKEEENFLVSEPNYYVQSFSQNIY